MPEAHVRLLDWELQAELYEVFHRGWVSRIGHLVCTPVVVAGTIGWLSHLRPGLGWVVTVAQLVYFVGLRRRLGLLALVPVVALGAIGQALAALPLPALGGLVVGAAALQAFSHTPEPMPPPWGRGDDWEDVLSFVRRASWRELLGVIGLVASAVFLEWWASYRIFGLQLHFLARQLGAYTEDHAWLVARREAIADDWRTGWGPEREARGRASHRRPVDGPVSASVG